MNTQHPKSLSSQRRRYMGAGIALLGAVIATTADARPVWQYADGGLIHGEPTSGEAYYPSLSCTAGRLTVVIPLSERAAAVRLRNDEYVDARGRAGPWPVRVLVRAGRVSTTVTGELVAESFGFPTATASVPAASPVGRAILSRGVVDASVRGESMHVPPIPARLLARLASDCRRAAPG